jgi:hypothetical protein
LDQLYLAPDEYLLSPRELPDQQSLILKVLPNENANGQQQQARQTNPVSAVLERVATAIQLNDPPATSSSTTDEPPSQENTTDVPMHDLSQLGDKYFPLLLLLEDTQSK